MPLGGVQVLPEVVRMLRRLKEQEEAAKEDKGSDESGDEDSSDAATGDMGSDRTPTPSPVLFTAKCTTVLVDCIALTGT